MHKMEMDKCQKKKKGMSVEIADFAYVLSVQRECEKANFNIQSKQLRTTKRYFFLSTVGTVHTLPSHFESQRVPKIALRPRCLPHLVRMHVVASAIAPPLQQTVSTWAGTLRPPSRHNAALGQDQSESTVARVALRHTASASTHSRQTDGLP